MSDSEWMQVVSSVVVFLCTAAGVWIAYEPLKLTLRQQETMYDSVLRGSLLLDIPPRVVTVATVVAIVLLGVLGYSFTGYPLVGLLAAVAGLAVPPVLMRMLRTRRLDKLESQLLSGIQSLASGVRAGLNLVQTFQLVARDAPAPLCQEFTHLLREYEFGVTLEEAMENAARRVGSGDFRLLISALQTHRERGGDLGETLDRIGESIREIQRLENRVKALTAQGRATARWLGAMPLAVACIYGLYDWENVRMLLAQGIGNIVIVAVLVLNALGFLWIRKIISIDL